MSSIVEASDKASKLARRRKLRRYALILRIGSKVLPFLFRRLRTKAAGKKMTAPKVTKPALSRWKRPLDWTAGVALGAAALFVLGLWYSWKSLSIAPVVKGTFSWAVPVLLGALAVAVVGALIY